MAEPYARGLSGNLSSIREERVQFLSLLSSVLSEARLTPEALDLPFEEKPGVQTFTAVVAAGAANVVGELATAWYDHWTVGLNDEELEDRLEDMVEDAILTMTLIYGASGFAAKGDRVFNADFITMHFVTRWETIVDLSIRRLTRCRSMNFVPIFALRPDYTRVQTLQPPLPLASRLLMLRAYLFVAMIWLFDRPMPTIEAFTAAIPKLYAEIDAMSSPGPPTHAYAQPLVVRHGQRSRRRLHSSILRYIVRKVVRKTAYFLICT